MSSIDTNALFKIFFEEVFNYENKLLSEGLLTSTRGNKLLDSIIRVISQVEDSEEYLSTVEEFIDNITNGRILPNEFYTIFKDENPTLISIAKVNKEISDNNALLMRINKVNEFFSDKSQSEKSASLSGFISIETTNEQKKSLPAKSEDFKEVSFPLLRVNSVVTDNFPTNEELNCPVASLQLGFRINPYSYGRENISFNSFADLKDRYDELRAEESKFTTYSSPLANNFKDIEKSLFGVTKRIFDSDIVKKYSSDYPQLRRPEMPFFFSDSGKNDILEYSLRKKLIFLTRSEIDSFFEEFKIFAAGTSIDWYSTTKLEKAHLEIFENSVDAFTKKRNFSDSKAYRFKYLFIGWIVAQFILGKEEFQSTRCADGHGNHSIPDDVIKIFSDGKDLRKFYFQQQNLFLERDKRFFK